MKTVMVDWASHPSRKMKDSCSARVYCPETESLVSDLLSEAITKKGHQPLHLLRKLRALDVDPTILKLCYHSWREDLDIFFHLPVSCRFTQSFFFFFFSCRFTQSEVCFYHSWWEDLDIFFRLPVSCRFTQSEVCFKGPWACPVWGVRTLVPQRRRFRSLAHKTNRRGNSCSLCSSPPQQGKISPLNQLFTIL